MQYAARSISAVSSTTNVGFAGPAEMTFLPQANALLAASDPPVDKINSTSG